MADEVGIHRSAVYRWLTDWKEELKKPPPLS
ncbi:helix-turn-helix domain-containing protein [uncultured Oscillibacter sp.]